MLISCVVTTPAILQIMTLLIFWLLEQEYPNDPKFSNRLVWANKQCRPRSDCSSIYNRHGLEIDIFNQRDDRAGWYRGSAEVPHSLVIPRVENADLKLMPHYRFYFLHTTTFYDQFKCMFVVYLAIYIVSNCIDHSQFLWLQLPGLCANNTTVHKVVLFLSLF